MAVFLGLFFAVELSALGADALIVHIILIAHEFVDCTVGSQLNDAVGHGVDKLMVVRCEEDVAAEALQVVVECLNRLHVEVVGGRVEDETVGIAQLHAGDHATHLFTSREDVDLLENFFVFEEHAAEEGLEIHLIAFAVLREPVEHVQVGVEELGVVERQIGRGDRDTPVVSTGSRLLVAVDDLEQCGHGAGIVADEHHLFLLFDLEAHLVEEHGAVVGHGFEILYLENLVAGFAIHLEDDARIAARRRLNFLDVELLEHLFARSRLTALCHVGREAADELLQLLLLLLGLLALVLRLAESELRRFVPERIVTREERHLAEVDVDRVGANLVEEVTVVRNNEHGVFEVAEIIFKPFHSFEVKVIGRLVEEEVVGLTEEGLCQHYAHLLLVGEVAHEFAVEGLLDAEAGKQGGGVVFGRVAADGGKLVFEFGYFDAVLVCEVFFRVEGVAFLHDLPHHSVTLQYGVKHRLVVEFEVVLRENRQAFAGTEFHLAFGGLEFAADGFEEGGFTGAVGTDDTIDVAVREFHVHILIEDALAELNGYVGKCDH